MISLAKFSPRNFDWLLFFSALLLCALGLAAIYSVELSRGLEVGYVRKQLIALGIGLFGLFFASLMQVSFFRTLSKPLYFFSLVLLVVVLVFGNTIRGTRGWFVLSGFSFQPVELAKAALILILAYSISNFGRRFERPLYFFGTLAITLTAIGLTMLQPDLGSAVLLGIIWFSLMLLTGARRMLVISFVSVMIIFSIFAWFFLLQSYQKERVLTFVNPTRDSLGAGYNTTQAIIAVGSGQLFGKGLGFGSQSQLRFLPEAQTDFVFSVIGEELGFAGVLVMLVLFSIMVWRLIVLASNSDDDFASVVVSGITVLIASQMFINVGANLGLLPVTGVTLPFVSYGGSSLIINLVLVGVAESMVVRRY
ncbi:MAG: rod shape-determining protein RodA [Candidatus Magasanikbacteria bacterium]